MTEIFSNICFGVFIILMITHIKRITISVRFRSMKYNDNKYSLVNSDEIQEALKIARNSEDEGFLMNSSRWLKLQTILFFIWILSLILYVFVNLNDW